jgi:hypothetical protein
LDELQVCVGLRERHSGESDQKAIRDVKSLILVRHSWNSLHSTFRRRYPGGQQTIVAGGFLLTHYNRKGNYDCECFDVGI